MKWKRLLPPLFLIVVWQVLSAIGLIPSFKLPSPLQTLAGLRDLVQLGMPPGHPLHIHILHSLHRVFWGYAMAVVIAVPMGIVMGWSRQVRELIDPIVELLRPIPAAGLDSPLRFSGSASADTSAAFIIFLGAFFPILLNTVNGVLSIDPVLIEAAHTLNASRRFIFFKVLVPGAFPANFHRHAHRHRHRLDDPGGSGIHRRESRLRPGLYDHDRPAISSGPMKSLPE